ncbi:hypothetical protein PTI45_04646 [Paenibacillus nuruki]|uniref:Uncharacterized protein n=1 Tax=Paenibacillus nuruki TaxID=1886670 RepID=A0A1E3KZ83_9BACL|nr:hypothetical protein [Paenibacillus nuruki]ODP26010.1 hypothetical protein PTI45_04646 [Paenibacillus nuruki]
MDEILEYLPEEVPDHLFTQNKLSRMGLKPIAESVACVSYPEQKRKYKLFNIHKTQQRKKQKKGLSLVQKDATIEQILDERSHEIEVRRIQKGETS